MPRKSIIDDEMPRRRRSRAAAIQEDSERGLAMRIFLHSPKDVIAGALALIAVCAIIINALFMQAGRHPAPMFGTVTVMPAVASLPAGHSPRRQAEADVPLPEARPVDARAADPKAADPLTSLVKTTSSVQPATANIPRPPLTVPLSSHVDSASVSGAHRVAAVQRALTEYGYGQLKPTGVVGADTQAAIERFERKRKLPVTGQVSDRLVRELASTIGHPVE
ncbi:peptidoglycan-binding domain-containing protein [Bradyrhizobium sp.]|uniref:peptidoglycan-binding domain-containing protein n=1 Tax=Bradyrhizobium sp. TaxID=376 RepID=UPI002D260D8F|nr:peptidoglycan-binding protein [Bradyrhizobium sp.]HZR75755.1 peptidoglycan-binding protein [Bradyrhizobium sp.]